MKPPAETDEVSREARDEAELSRLARAAAAHEPSFERLVREVYPRLHRWALVVTGDGDDADDAVQEALLRIHRSLPDFRGDSRVTTWLYRIVRTAAIDLVRRRKGRRRKRRRLAAHEIPEAVRDAPVARMEAERRLELVRTFWRELPPGQREVFDLADLQGRAPKEIAGMLEMNPSTVRAHLFKARRTIRTRMLERVEGMEGVEGDADGHDSMEEVG